MKLNLEDLQPKEATFVLSETGDKQHVLKKFSLAVQAWLVNHWPGRDVSEVFKDKNILELSELAYYMLKDKSPFPTIEQFHESIVTFKDRVAITKALVETIGLSQPVLDKALKEAKEGNAPSPVVQPTGAPTTT